MLALNDRGSCLKLKTKILYTLCLALFTAACGGSGAGNPTQDLLGGGYAPGEVRALEFGSDGNAAVDFGELSGGEQFALIFFAAGVNQGNFGVQVKSARDSSSTPPPRYLRAPSPYLPETEAEQGDPSSNFHELLRQEEQIVGQVLAQNGSEKFYTAGGADSLELAQSWNVPCADGTGILMKVINNLSNIDSYDTVCAIAQRTTSHAIYYVDETIAGSINNSTLNSVIDDFEAKIDRERSLIGQESDVNGDGRFAVCFCPSVNRLGNSAGGYVTGFFFGGDLISAESMPSSNEKEILFISVPDPSGQWGTVVPTDFWVSNIAKSVLPHEYQHMINYRFKVLNNQIGAEESWANEGLSHLMEDLDSHQSDPLPRVGMENPSRVAIFLQTPQTAAFTGGTSLAQRGGAYLFFRYLYEQANRGRYPGVIDGAELLSKLIASPFKGVKNIEEATGWPFRNILMDFYATLQLSNTGISDDPRYNFQGINLNGEQDDNRGTVLSGVQSQTLSTVPVTGSVNSPGGLFYNLGGNTIEGAGSSLNFSADPGMIPGGAVIRLQ
jgi:hypothetical protein